MKFTSSGRRKNRMAFVLIHLLAFMVMNSTGARAQADSSGSSGYIRGKAAYSKMFPFINYEQNYIEWIGKQSLEPFFSKLSQSAGRKVKVLHIGDSHVQADFFTGFIRERMQDIFGYGGRGFVFPYACASTHATYDYRTYGLGIWEYAKNVQQAPLLELGITGATVRTHDTTAGFTFAFKPDILQKNFNAIKIYCKQSPQSFDLKMKVSGLADTIRIDCNKAAEQGFITVKLPAIGDTIRFWVDKNEPGQSFFECYGILIESSASSGVLYNSVGINGAGYISILRQSLLPSQLAELSPDLVIIDVGANDFYPRMIIEPDFQNNLAGVIDMVRKGAPGSSIIVSCSQDIYKRSRNVAACKRFAEIARAVAFSKGCGFYDYYNVSGGQYAMLKWLKSNLAKKDKVHLNAEGYNVKGELYLNAMLNSYLQFLEGGLMDTFLVKNGVPPMEITLNPTLPDSIKKQQPDIDPGNVVAKKMILHRVRQGETIGGIAAKYGVTVSQVRSWNNLSSNKIIAGKTLKIHASGKGGGISSAPKPSTQNKQGSKQSGANKAYTVRQGDSLWSIAQKFNTTVESLKKLNDLKSNSLQPGTKLIIAE